MLFRSKRFSARCVKNNLSYNRLFSVALPDTIMYNDPKLIKEGFFMDKIIKEIEDMSLNAWPSHKMELYDGWILRFSYFYTHRTNSVEQFGTSTLSWREKVSFCETEYARLGSPAIFKISPLVSPDFDYLLENRNYEIQHTTNVKIVRASCRERV